MPTEQRPGGRATAPPPQVTMGLLDYLTSHSLDQDYAHVAQGRRAAGGPVGPGVTALLVLGLFGLLVATAAVQTSRNAGASETGRESLITQIEARGAQVDARREQIGATATEVDELRAALLSATSLGRSLADRTSRLGVAAGTAAVSGPGVRVVVDDAPNATSEREQVLDRDLQRLVNALWGSGAEAISINGERLTTLSAIRHAGSAITVNYTSISPPYVVLAVGDPDSIPARFVDTRHGTAWLDLQAAYGLQFDMTAEESLTLPAADDPILRFATPGEAR